MGAGMVSLIITAHNEGNNVYHTVESILMNTEQPEFEIVLIDDGSTDDSFAFLNFEPYCNDERLRRFRFEQPLGVIRARHEGTRLARGNDLVFLDAHMAMVRGWLVTLMKSLERWGPYVAITPDISVLNRETWLPTLSSGQFIAINEKLDMVWRQQIYHTGLVPMVHGCCWIIPRQFYFQMGGFDVGLCRWGCENIDASLKVYAAGGTCYLESSVIVGHLFRKEFPYSMRYEDLTYNKLRIGYVHFADGSFRRLVDCLRDEPGFAEAMVRFRADLSELGYIRRVQQTANRRDPDWFVRTFLPGLCGMT